MADTAVRARIRAFKNPSRLDIIGHRGFGAIKNDSRHENSTAAVARAAASGADWVEIDVRRAADSRLVAHHDNFLAPTSLVSDSRASELWAHAITDFADICSIMPTTVGLNIEVKSTLSDAHLPPHQSTVELVLDHLSDSPPDCPVLLTSFDVAVLIRARERAPQLPVGLLTWQDYPIEMGVNTAAHLQVHVLATHVSSLGLRYNSVLPASLPTRAVETCSNLGIQVMAWGGKPADIPKLHELGVAAVCVDDVKGAVHKRDASH